ncbi:TonB-dependent receptor [Chitinophaga alhagiae]|uniref:TonB-dependent receptor n=1 Tax=Chitinophaga alhagiae TaxID=2203219 RepID=UPI0018E57D8E|nr:TonB-dependent receptor [Chitinophaga alhagiae]
MKIVTRISLYLLGLFAVHAAQAQHVLRGVVQSRGAGVAAATVTAYNGQYRHTVQTSLSGHFVMRLPAGSFTVTVSCIGFAAADSSVHIGQSPPPLLSIELRAVEQGLAGITVTGTRYAKEDDLVDIKKIASPVAVIDKKQISAMGSRRLDEVLREQTGMAVVNDLGAGNRSIGLQMQGFGSEHILILLNGQPMTGRFNGNFDLSRISVSDIERIEIIKGASSSLYGSEALGGVVNIITRQRFTATRGAASLLYGTYNTLDAGVEGETGFRRERGGAYVAANMYRTDGFNANTAYLKNGQTSPPYHSYNLQGRLVHSVGRASTLHTSLRFGNRNSVMTRSYGAQPFRDKLRETDLNGSLVLNSRFSSGWQLLLRYYFTQYATDQAVRVVETGHTLQHNEFSQFIHRLEAQTEKKYFSDRLTLTGGAGGEYQQMSNTLAEGRNSMTNYFIYAQANYTPVQPLTIIAGGRYDGNTVYGGRLNPSLGLRYRALPWLALNASLGQGYKAPTYAQLYQVFTNITQGYTVIGANNFAEKAAAMQHAGLIQQIWPNAGQLGNLRPEVSTSYNAGIQVTAAGRITIGVNGFYNSISDLINTEQVGIMKNGQQLFSYFNIARTYTRGVETSLKYHIFKGLQLTAGYQYLQAKSRDVEDAIKTGSGAYGLVRTESGIRPARPSDYFGLPNRSRHMANLQLLYEHAPWGLTVSARGSYRGKYGFLDMDNNGYIDTYDVFVKAYTLVNIAVQKELLARKLLLRLSVDNIGNYTDYLMPSQPGRVLMAGFTWRFAKKEKLPQ